jgi:hypothetical protein
MVLPKMCGMRGPLHVGISSCAIIISHFIRLLHFTHLKVTLALPPAQGLHGVEALEGIFCIEAVLGILPSIYAPWIP